MVLCAAIFVPWSSRPAMETLEAQEGMRLKLLEEGVADSISSVEVWGSKRKREDGGKEKYN